MEELYHVEKDDSVVGQVSRDEAHRKGILHRAGMVFVTRRDARILLTKRSPSKETFPDLYDSSCAFHVTFGESYEDAARRELLEETGIRAMPAYLGKFSFHEPPENEMVAVFKCESDEPIVIDRSESAEADWYSIADVDRIVGSERVTPWLRNGWRLARNKISLPPRGLLRAGQVLGVESLKQEVISAILSCKEKNLFEHNVLSTSRLTRELNNQEFRSKEWDPFAVGMAMVELGFDMSVTSISNQRGWCIDDEKISTLAGRVSLKPKGN